MIRSQPQPMRSAAPASEPYEVAQTLQADLRQALEDPDVQVLPSLAWNGRGYDLSTLTLEVPLARPGRLAWAMRVAEVAEGLFAEVETGCLNGVRSSSRRLQHAALAKPDAGPRPLAAQGVKARLDELPEEPQGIDIAVSATVYAGALDPLASSVPVELDLPVPTWRKAGGGHQAIYRGVTVEQAWRVIEALEDRANATSRYDARYRAAGRAVRDTALRLRRQMAAALLVEGGGQQD